MNDSSVLGDRNHDAALAEATLALDRNVRDNCLADNAGRQFDLKAIEEAGYDTTTVVVVTNTKKLTDVTPVTAGPIGRGDTAITVTL